MQEQMSLTDAYRKTQFQLLGHGKRSIQVLKDVLDSVDGTLDSDMYGSGDIIENFQNKMTAYLGKEASVFFPSGTMAQQIALRIWCDRKGRNEVAYHPLCHLEIHEQDGLKQLHHIQPVLLADKDRLITLADVKNMRGPVSCLLLELPQREIGGQLPSFDELQAISDYCRANGIALHLDGARLFECLPFYGKSADEVCRLFDSVYVSFYKGIGGIAGAILAGDRGLIDEAVIWKRRHGGDLISLYPYILSAESYFDQRIGKMEQYFQEARELAASLNRVQHLSTLPEVPVSNMFHVRCDLPKESAEPILIDVYQNTGVGLTGYLKELDDSSCAFEASIGDLYGAVPEAKRNQFIEALADNLGKYHTNQPDGCEPQSFQEHQK